MHAGRLCLLLALVGQLHASASFGNKPLEATFATQLLVYNRYNSSDIVGFEDADLLNDYLDASHSTKVLIHGFRKDLLSNWFYDAKNALLSQEDCQVILVGWGAGAKLLNYLKVVDNARSVGKWLGNLIQRFTEQRRITLRSVHLIGHSLGAHIAGIAGKSLNGTVGRITGLDPAGPGFHTANLQSRLCRTDAMFVDVIHTNAALFGAGLMEPIGDVDFYPNGGQQQTGCSSVDEIPLPTIVRGFNKINQLMSCSHSRAHSLFTSTISNSSKLYGFACSSMTALQLNKCYCCDQSAVVMGYNLPYTLPMDKSAPSKLYLGLTGSKAPFEVSTWGVRLKLAGGSALNSIGSVRLNIDGLEQSVELITNSTSRSNGEEIVRNFFTELYRVGNLKRDSTLKVHLNMANNHVTMQKSPNFELLIESMTIRQLGSSAKFATGNVRVTNWTALTLRLTDESSSLAAELHVSKILIGAQLLMIVTQIKTLVF